MRIEIEILGSGQLLLSFPHAQFMWAKKHKLSASQFNIWFHNHFFELGHQKFVHDASPWGFGLFKLDMLWAGQVYTFEIFSYAMIIQQILHPSVGSDGHDKPFCTKAITIVDNFKKALGDTDKSQFLKAISII